MPAAGDTFRLNTADSHLYVALSSTGPAIEEFAAVNLTTKRDGPGEDHTCVMEAGEHPFIVHATFALYRKAEVFSEAKFREAYSQGQLVMRENASLGLLKRLQAGALTSRFTPKRVKTLVQAELAQQRPNPDSSKRQAGAQ